MALKIVLGKGKYICTAKHAVRSHPTTKKKHLCLLLSTKPIAEKEDDNRACQGQDE
jgi:hypothetical protein